tara:strand:+ start:1093 stop:1665 length:573 start_codon:yes stop_codon:yes gene_type:complete
MNIGNAVKQIQKKYPSVTISRLRFLEKEGLIKPKRSKGGTRDFTNKDIDRIFKILNLQEDQFYSLKAIKNNTELLSKNIIKNIKIQEYSKHDALKKSGLSIDNFMDLINYNFEEDKEKFTQNEVDRLSSFAYFYNLGLTAKNFTIIKSLSDRGLGFFELLKNNPDINEKDYEIAVNKFSYIIGSYILEDS